MKIICITVNDSSYVPIHVSKDTPPTPRAPRAKKHFLDQGVEVQSFFGIYAAKIGVKTELPYELDAPGSGFNIGFGPVGCWLSHRAVWAACLLLPDDLFFIIEDDAKFPDDWRTRIDRAVADAGDFDILYVGSCCTDRKPTRHIAGEVFEVKWPFCTHGYIVRRSALPVLIATQDEARLYAPIDVSLALHSLSHLKTLVVRPRVLDQFDTEMPT